MKISRNVGKILFFSIIVLQWNNLACAFRPTISEPTNYNKVHEQKKQESCAFLGNTVCAPVLPIIPGMIGAGVETPAGSGPDRAGGSILHVITLNDSGPGSLREALKARGPRVIVFDVSGYIELQSRLDVTEPYLTLAGQTAPFPGISLKGSGLNIRTHDVLVQHIRIRVGDAPNGPKPSTRDALTINGSKGGAHHIVIDHVSTSWAIDENVSTYDTVYDVTFANSIASEGLWHSIHPKGPHSRGFIVGPKTRNLLVIGNLFAHNNQRNMRVKGDTGTLFVNNLIYNWQGAGSTVAAAGDYGSGNGSLEASIVGNVFIRGLDSRSIQNAHPIVLRSNVVAGSKVFIKDTVSDTSSNVLVQTSDNVRVNVSPNWIPNLIAKNSNVVKNWILSNVGARRADRDPIDQRIINDVKNGTGRIIDSQNNVGGWPPLAENVRGIDGIPTLVIPSNEIQPSGYTKVEDWLHRLAKQVETH